jgi:OOP family OmpA-OmpF porin
MAIGILALATLGARQGWSQSEAEPPWFSVTPDRFEGGGFVGAHFFASEHGLGRYASDPLTLSPENGFALGGRLTWSLIPRLSVEVELSASPTHTRDGATSMWVFGYRANLLGYLLSEGRARPFVLVGVGALSSVVRHETVIENDTDPMMHAGVGAKFVMDETWGIRIDGRLLLPPAIASDLVSTGGETKFGGPDFELLVGAYVALGVAPKPVPLVVEPPPPPVDEDTDDDGWLDKNDKCPNEAEDKDGFEDTDGCPEIDNDADGIVDQDDKCPMEAEDKDGFEDDDGCPDGDNDVDGIPDADDRCPNEPETKNGFEDEDGCPDDLPAEVKEIVGPVKGIAFAAKQAKLLRSSSAILDQIVDVMANHPAIRIEISGHTDDRGDPEANKELSAQRAQAVKDYLVEKGIVPERLQVVGVGSERPVADNNTAAGRVENRRIELKLVF